MFKLIFELKQITDAKLRLQLHWGFRVVFLVLLFLVISSSLATAEERAVFAPIPVILIALFAIIGLYQESWTFDKANGLITNRHGLIFLNKKTKFQAEEVDRLEIQEFRKGSIKGQEKTKRFFQKDLLRFSLVMSDSSRKDIEITEAKNKTALHRKAASIADFMEMSYKSEV